MNAWTEYNGEGGSDVQPVRASGMRGEGVGKDACTNTHTRTHSDTGPLARVRYLRNYVGSLGSSHTLHIISPCTLTYTLHNGWELYNV